MIKNRWNGVQGLYSVECYVGPNGLAYDAHTDESIPQWLNMFVRGCCEIVVEFESAGYDDPATRHCPAEHDDERTLVRAYIFDNGKKYPLPQNIQEALLDVWQSDIDACEIDWPEDDRG